VFENNYALWSWGEKLADCYLGWSFPFYVGCKNVENDLLTAALLRIDPKLELRIDHKRLKRK